MLELKGVSKSYQGATVLGQTDLKITTGQTTVLIGPSGCGKSTLLRLMIGLIQPDNGTVRFQDELMSGRNVSLLRRRMGYVIQDGGLFPHLTGRRNVTLMARYLRWEPARIDRRVAELLELTQLPKDALSRYPAQLSGGQRQRISLMRALMLDPDILLFDEPLGALDPMIRAELQRDLSEIFRTLNKTVALVTHDLAEAAYFGDTIVLLRQGRIVQQGKISEFTERPAEPFVSEFFSAQQHLIAAPGGAQS
jgi:osmoprotectant transport system ATP-binding protein